MARALASLCSVLAGLTAGCYSPPEPDCGFVCGPFGECPAHYGCGPDNRCLREGAAASSCMIDAGFQPIPIDGAPDADVSAPLVTSTMPASGATGADRSGPIQAFFNENVYGVDGASFLCSSAGSPLAGSVSLFSFETYMLWGFIPSSSLAPTATVECTLTTAIHDDAGNHLAAPYSWSFQTGN